jgi:hypothetical protein
MRDRIGILGVVGILILLVWAVGWLVLGWHTGLYHLLVPLGIFVIAVQMVRRVAAPH